MKGLELSRAFYEALVAPLLEKLFPGMAYAAGLLGPGSDVQGFDTPVSQDHDWGPRLLIFLDNREKERCGRVKKALEARMPERFLGYELWYGYASDGVSVSEERGNGSGHTLIQVTTVVEWTRRMLGAERLPLSLGQWLRLSDQRLREVTGGEIFWDPVGELTRLRRAVSYFPDQVWIYRMASLWSEMAEEAQFTGRTGDVGDDLGSRVIAARQARRMMLLAFLMERRYAPYAKWLGTAFSRLEMAPKMRPGLEKMLSASDWKARVEGQGAALSALMDKHQALGLGPELERRGAPYRPQYLTCDVQPVIDQLKALLEPPLCQMAPLGGISDFMENTPAQCDPQAKALGAWLKQA